MTGNRPNFVSDAFAELLAKRRILHRGTRPCQPRLTAKRTASSATSPLSSSGHLRFRSEAERRIRLKR